MANVRILAPEVAEKIAAGEVIERPASVVKELVENSIDAGARSVSVTVERGGKALIRVSDDGAGMAREDLEVAFHRHATSKIRTVDDLFAIQTMGFRGEALASIAAVARVRMVTRADPSTELRTGPSATTGAAASAGLEAGLSAKVGAGGAASTEFRAGSSEGPGASAWEAVVEPPAAAVLKPAARARGTTVEVRDLFFNIPARKKFLGRDETELGHITRFMQAAALAFPGIAMNLAHGTRKIFEAPAADSVRRRVAAFYGQELADDLVEAQGGREGLKVYALLAPPFYSRTSGYSQYIYVNGRYVRDRVLAGAVSHAYAGILEARRFPIVFLYVTIAPEDVDVNVHPAKMEIRFRDSGAVRGVVAVVLSEALLKADFAPRIGGALDQGGGGGFGAQGPRAENILRSIEAFYERRIGGLPGPYGAGSGGAYGPGAGGGASGGAAVSGAAGAPFGAAQGPQGNLLQVRGTYIVQETNEGIAIIDQHALHERIIYAEVRRRLAEGRLSGQRLLIPDVIEVSPEERLAAERSGEVLGRLGIELATFGEEALAVNAFPAVLGDADRERLVRDVLSEIMQAPGSRTIEEALTALAEVVACHAAVRAGEALNGEELAALVAKAEETEARYACPHGRPTKLVLTFEELERRFKRR